MSGLKREIPGLRFGAFGTNPPVNQITPDEIDRYEVYSIVNPTQGASGAGHAWYFLGTSGTADVITITALNVIADYPRNVRFAITGSSTGEAGSVTINGRDQFGNAISETLGFGSADNGGTVEGTKIFAQFTSGTVRCGTYAGNGTIRLGVGLIGTTALFGLPFKIGAATDVKVVNVTTGTGAVSINGGTIATYVDTTNHAIKAPLTLTGTMSLQVWAKPTFNAENLGIVANLPQRT